MTGAHVLQAKAPGKGPSVLLALGCLLLVALAMHAGSLLFGRVIESIDLRTHYQWSVQFLQVLGEGTLYPRWLPLANGGLGEPSFTIVHPAWYYAMALLQALGVETWLAMRLLGLLATWALGAVAFWWLRQRMPSGQALGVAVLVEAVPFGIFLFGFHAALPWQASLPLLFLFVALSVDLACEPEPRWDLRLVAVVALLCVTHLLVTFMGGVCIGAALLVRALAQRRAGLFGRWLGAVLLGAGVVALYWLLAATSGSLFTVALREDEVYLNWKNSFIFPLVTSRLFGTRWFVAQWVLPVAPLLACLATAWMLRAVPAPKRTPAWQRAAMLLTVSAVALAMASELAFPLYQALGFLRNVQWPYRFQTVAAVAALPAMALAWSALAAAQVPLARFRLVWGVAAAASLVLALMLGVQQVRDSAKTRIGPALMSGLFGQRGAEPAGIGPHWQRYVDGGGLAGHCRALAWRCETRVAHGHQHRFVLQGDAPARLLLPLFDFPAWRVQVNGQAVPSVRDADTGVLALDLPAGSHDVVVTWSPLWQERWGLGLSVLSLMLVLAMAVRQRTRGATPGLATP